MKKKKYRFGKYKAYGLFYEVSYGNYEIVQPNGNTYLINSVDGEEYYDIFELENIDSKGKWHLSSYFDKFYINKENAIFLTSNVTINPLSEKLIIGEEYYDFDNPKIYAKDIYKDKYILVSNDKKIEIPDIKNNIIAAYETNEQIYDISFKQIEDKIYIDANGKERQLFIFDGKNIIKKEN